MVKELTPDQLRDYGFPELALYQEQELANAPKDKDTSASKAPDQYLPP